MSYFYELLGIHKDDVHVCTCWCSLKTTRTRYENNQRSVVQLRPMLQVRRAYAVYEHSVCVGQKKKKKRGRTEQDSNLRGQSPLDFESNALTTRPSVQILRADSDITVLLPLHTAGQP